MADQQSVLYFVGTAGAGKSTLVAAYDRWAKAHGLSTVLVNLDPGAESLPYTPDIDIRDRVRLADVMAEHNLGPNGAQIAAADMIALGLEELMEDLGTFRADQILIDTPGQLELFVFRQAGRHIVQTLAPGHSFLVYLMDPFLAGTASGFASQLLLGSTVFFRFQEPIAFLLSKADACKEEKLKLIQAWGADPGHLESDVVAESPSMDREFAAQVSRLLETMGVQNRLVPVSSVDGRGLDDLYNLVQGAIGQSEDSTPEYDTFLGQGQEEAGDERN